MHAQRGGHSLKMLVTNVLYQMSKRLTLLGRHVL
jgi:hypothetical protein